MKKFNQISIFVLAVAFVFGLTGLNSAQAATSPTLNVLDNYSVLGGGSITNVPTTTTDGDIGVSPGTALGGGYAGTGTPHSNDSSAINAQAEALTTFGTLDQTCDYGPYAGVTDLSVLNVGSGAGNLPAGVYCASTAFEINTTLNLTGSGVWIFKTGTTLVAAVGSTVTGGDPCNVWWRVGSSTTLNAGSHLIGTVISQNGDNHMRNEATLDGRFLALSAATVTLDQNTITTATCTSAAASSSSSKHHHHHKSKSKSKAKVVPKLPAAGIGPQEKNTPWSVVIPVGILMLVSTLLVMVKRKRAI